MWKICRNNNERSAYPTRAERLAFADSAALNVNLKDAFGYSLKVFMYGGTEDVEQTRRIRRF